MDELESCPACGALPCDWANNPYKPAAAPGDEAMEVWREEFKTFFDAVSGDAGHMPEEAAAAWENK